MKVKIIEREVLNPLADSDVLETEINTIPQKIDSIAFIDNTKPNADTILDNIQQNLEIENFIIVTKPAGAPATSEQINQASQADIAILAVGDCGSCTTWLILDAIKLEEQGIPTISICSDIFAPFAREIADYYGAGDLRILDVEHPIAGQLKEAIEAKTLGLIREIKTVLNQKLR